MASTFFCLYQIPLVVHVFHASHDRNMFLSCDMLLPCVPSQRMTRSKVKQALEHLHIYESPRNTGRQSEILSKLPLIILASLFPISTIP